MGPNHNSSEKHRLKRVWERLMLDPGDISDLRARLTSNITILEGFIANITERKTQKSLARLEKQAEEQEQKQILDWISKDCESQTDRFNWFVSRHEPETRKWLFDSKEWQAWTSDQGRGTTLYCPGIPGAGKTHASASKQTQRATAPPRTICYLDVFDNPTLIIKKPQPRVVTIVRPGSRDCFQTPRCPLFSFA